MTAKELLNIMREEGADIEGKEDEILKELVEALAKKQVYTIYRGVIPIGLLTWFRAEKGIFINNLVIFRKFRNKNSLLSARSAFRKLVGSKFYGFSKRRQRLCSVT